MDHRCMYNLARRIEGLSQHHIGYAQTSFYNDTENATGEWQWGAYAQIPQLGCV